MRCVTHNAAALAGLAASPRLEQVDGLHRAKLAEQREQRLCRNHRRHSCKEDAALLWGLALWHHCRHRHGAAGRQCTADWQGFQQLLPCQHSATIDGLHDLQRLLLDDGLLLLRDRLWLLEDGARRGVHQCCCCCCVRGTQHLRVQGRHSGYASRNKPDGPEARLRSSQALRGVVTER